MGVFCGRRIKRIRFWMVWVGIAIIGIHVHGILKTSVGIMMIDRRHWGRRMIRMVIV